MNSVVVYFQNKQTNKLSLLSLFDSSLHPLADDWEYSTSSLCFFLQQSSPRMCEHQQQNVITTYYVLHMKCEVQFREFNEGFSSFLFLLHPLYLEVRQKICRRWGLDTQQHTYAQTSLPLCIIKTLLKQRRTQAVNHTHGSSSAGLYHHGDGCAADLRPAGGV